MMLFMSSIVKILNPGKENMQGITYNVPHYQQDHKEQMQLCVAEIYFLILEASIKVLGHPYEQCQLDCVNPAGKGVLKL